MGKQGVFKEVDNRQEGKSADGVQSNNPDKRGIRLGDELWHSDFITKKQKCFSHTT